MKKQSEPFWNNLVAAYFRWHRLHYGEPPVFKGSSPRDLRLIVAMLHQHFMLNWNERFAMDKLNLFLSFAHETEPYLRDHWTLAELYKMRESIFHNWTK